MADRGKEVEEKTREWEGNRRAIDKFMVGGDMMERPSYVFKFKYNANRAR